MSFRAAVLKLVRNSGVMLWTSAGLVSGGLSANLTMDTQGFLERAKPLDGKVVSIAKTVEATAAPQSAEAVQTAKAGTGGQASIASPVTGTLNNSTPTAKAEVPQPKEPVYRMTVEYKPSPGGPLTVVLPATATTRTGDPVKLLVDPANTKDARLVEDGNRWVGPVLLAIASLATLLIGFFLYRKSQAALPFKDIWLDETKFNFYPLQIDTIDGYLGTASAPASPPRGITATAAAIQDGENGRYPLALCEMMAYLSTLAYENQATLQPYLTKWFGTAFTNLGFFDKSHTQGFGFLFEDTVYIVMRGTEGGKEGRSDWAQNLKFAKAAPDALLPKDANWTVAGRHRGFAEAWDVVRDDIEAWLATDPRLATAAAFIFSGHSLGGALAFHGAYEFSKRNRNVAAVVTFGAPMPGNAEFAVAYDATGLGARTLRLQFDQDFVPVVLGWLGFRHVGREWLPEKPPLQYRRVLISAAVVGAMVSLVKLGLKKKKSTFMDELRRPALNKLTLFLAYAGPAAMLALAAHKMQSRYALALSVMSYQRIRELKAPDGTEAQFDESHAMLSRHLQRIRGADAQNPGKLFDQMQALPNKISSRLDLDWYRQWYPNRTF